MIGSFCFADCYANLVINFASNGPWLRGGVDNILEVNELTVNFFSFEVLVYIRYEGGHLVRVGVDFSEFYWY